MREIIRIVVLFGAIWGGYFLVARFTRLSGWKKHSMAWLGGLLVAGLFIGATETNEERLAKVERIQAAKIAEEKERAEKAAIKAAEEEKRKAAMAVEDLRMNISFACEKAVRDKLLSPKSADFSSFKEHIGINDKGQWVVSNEVEVKNAYGVEVRHSFTCVVDAQDGKVSVKGLAFAQ